MPASANSANDSQPIPTSPWDPATPSPAATFPGAAVSGSPRFIIEKLHAQGGLGQVSLAMDGQLKRPVALKEIRPDRRTEEARRRFVNEAEITGQLEHPGIVPIYALEKDAAGEPYYAMRFIQGRPMSEGIKQFHEPAPLAGRASDGRIGENRPSLARPANSFDSLAFRQLLQRFISVCQTVAYAHSKGVVHRDLKPANVMLGDYGETLVVDWGLAKRLSVVATSGLACPSSPTAEEDKRGRLSPRHEQATLPAPSDATQPGQALGTPAYMAPEQARGEWERVGPAADIFSLGATLYELLTNHKPMPGKDVFEVMDNARAGQFPPPRRVKSDVPKPIEAVCLKAMAFKPEERYATAKELAADVEHWLADEPVSAFDEPWPVRAGRWARKHRTLVASGVASLVVVIAALTIGITVVSGLNADLASSNSQLDTANRDLDHRNAELHAANQRANNEAKRATDRANQVKANEDFLIAVFRKEDPAADTRKLLVVDLLHQAAKRLEEEYKGEPATKARLLDALGQTHYNLGEYATAVELHEQALSLRRGMADNDSEDLLDGENLLGRAYERAGRPADAIRIHEEVRDAQQQKLGAGHPHTLMTLNNLARAYHAAGKLPQAIALFEHVRDASVQKLGADHLDTLLILNNLASAYYAAGKLPQAITLYERVHDAKVQKLGPEHAGTVLTLNNLASGYYAAGKLPEAIALYERVRNAEVQKLGADHPASLTTLNNLAAAYYAAGKQPQAITLFEQVRDGHVQKLGADHPETLTTLNNLAMAYLTARKLPEAITLLEQVRDTQVQKLGADHPDTLVTLNNLALAYQAAGKLDLALPLFGQAASGVEKQQFMHEHAVRIIPYTVRANEAAQQFDKAESWQRKWLAVVKERSGAESAAYAGELAGLGLNLLKQKKWGDAESVLRECLAIREKQQPEEWTTFNTQSMLGEALLGQQKYADAEALLLAGYEGMVQRLDRRDKPGGSSTGGAPTRERVIEAVARLVRLYDAWAKPDEAAKWRAVLAERLTDALLRDYAWPLLWGRAMW